MGNVTIANTERPSYLVPLTQLEQEDWGAGTSGFPVISTKSKIFRIRRGEEETIVMNPKDPDSAAQFIQVVVLKPNKGLSKTYYKHKYVEGTTEKPTCASPDGIAPFPDSEDRQAAKCSLCPHNQWGSRMTEDGKKAKSCSDIKRLAVAPNGQLNDPMLLRVPPTSLTSWNNYQQMLAKRGLTPRDVITKISFDPNVSHQLFIFEAVSTITADMVPALMQACADPILDNIVGSALHSIDPVAVDETPAAPIEEPKSSKKPAGKKAAKPAPVPEPVVEEEKEVEDEEPEIDTSALGDLDFDSLSFGDEEEEVND